MQWHEEEENIRKKKKRKDLFKTKNAIYPLSDNMAMTQGITSMTSVTWLIVHGEFVVPIINSKRR